jgi:hypothetical protein
MWPTSMAAGVDQLIAARQIGSRREAVRWLNNRAFVSA